MYGICGPICMQSVGLYDVCVGLYVVIAHVGSFQLQSLILRLNWTAEGQSDK